MTPVTMKAAGVGPIKVERIKRIPRTSSGRASKLRPRCETTIGAMHSQVAANAIRK
jgi:hypothetical protein